MTVLHFRNRECEKVRRQLDAYLSNELLVETTGEVQKHLEKCAECSQDLETRMRVRELLRKAVESQQAPPELRDRIHRQLRASQQANTWSLPPARWWAVIAAMVLLVVGSVAGRLWLRLRRSQSVVAATLQLGVQDHVHCALQAKNYPPVPPTPEQLRAKLGSDYSGLVPVVIEKLPGYQILDGHICRLPGSPRKYIHFIAQKNETILSVVLTRKEGASLARSGLQPAEAASSVGLYEAHLEGMDVAGFETQDYLGFVVSDIGEQPVLEIAANLAPKVRDVLRSSQGPPQPGVADRVGFLVARRSEPSSISMELNKER